MKTSLLFALWALALPAGMQCGGGQDAAGSAPAEDRPAAVVAFESPPPVAEVAPKKCDCECDEHAPTAGAQPLSPQDFAAIAANDASAFGPDDAPVTLVLFADYQCPYCVRLRATLSTLRAEYGDRIRIVVRNLPLPMHDNARLAARATLAAAAQGRFEAFESALYASKSAPTAATLEQIASQVGLNETEFQRALTSNELDDRIEHDLSLAGRVGAKGTPTLFINGKRVVGSQPIAEYRAIIDKELSD